MTFHLKRHVNGKEVPIKVSIADVFRSAPRQPGQRREFRVRDKAISFIPRPSPLFEVYQHRSSTASSTTVVNIQLPFPYLFFLVVIAILSCKSPSLHVVSSQDVNF